jgi:hypothetical protein
MDESALQAYLGNKKYGKEGMDALRKAGRDDASKEEMTRIRDKYNKLDEEGEFAGDYATGEAGQWRNKGPKAHKPATIGDLVGENFINTDAQAVVTEVDTGEYDARKSTPKGETTPDQEKEFRKKIQAYGKELEQRQKEKEKVKEGHDDLAAMMRIINR